MKDEIEENPLVIVSDIENHTDWLEDAKRFVNSKEYSEAMDLVMRVIAEKGNVPQPKVASLVARLSALSTTFRVQSVAYQSYYKGTKDANAIKNHYFAIYNGIDRLVDSLKYLVKT